MDRQENTPRRKVIHTPSTSYPQRNVKDWRGDFRMRCMVHEAGYTIALRVFRCICCTIAPLHHVKVWRFSHGPPIQPLVPSQAELKSRVALVCGLRFHPTGFHPIFLLFFAFWPPRGLGFRNDPATTSTMNTNNRNSTIHTSFVIVSNDWLTALIVAGSVWLFNPSEFQFYGAAFLGLYLVCRLGNTLSVSFYTAHR